MESKVITEAVTRFIAKFASKEGKFYFLSGKDIPPGVDAKTWVEKAMPMDSVMRNYYLKEAESKLGKTLNKGSNDNSEEIWNEILAMFLNDMCIHDVIKDKDVLEAFYNKGSLLSAFWSSSKKGRLESVLKEIMTVENKLGKNSWAPEKAFKKHAAILSAIVSDHFDKEKPFYNFWESKKSTLPIESETILGQSIGFKETWEKNKDAFIKKGNMLLKSPKPLDENTGFKAIISTLTGVEVAREEEYSPTFNQVLASVAYKLLTDVDTHPPEDKLDALREKAFENVLSTAANPIDQENRKLTAEELKQIKDLSNPSL